MAQQTRRMQAARLLVLVAFLDLFMQFPVVSPYARDLGASTTMVGLIVAAYSATNLFGNLAAGVAVDRWGRSRPVLLGLVATAASLLLYTAADGPAMLLFARALHGVSASVLTPGAFAIIGDAAPPGARARAMGAGGALIALSAIVGPPLSGVVGDWLGYQAVFLGVAALMLLTAAAVAALLRGNDRPAPTSAEPIVPSVERVPPLWARPGMIVASVTAFALTVGLGALVTQLPLLISARGEPASRTGSLFSVFAVVAIVVMAGPLGQLSDRYGRNRPLALGLALVGVGLALLGRGGGLALFAVGMGVFGLGFGLLFPAATALVAETATPTERGAAFGLFYAVYSLGVVVGSVLTGVLDDLISDGTPIPFLISALPALIAAAALIVLRRRMERLTRVGLS